ncbi:MAG: MiaB/RimO family radical SAM methylthiotransferase [Thermoleophilia bacterium]|nr:MiaB/RimO family radical SAM methylthiotransferase [Thermoleophilia bacterium]
MNKIHTHTLGCKVNFADLQSVLVRLDIDSPIPVAIVGTCCVTAEGEKQSRKEVRRASRQIGEDGSVFVTGCAARLKPEEFAGLADNVVVLTGEPDEVARGIIESLGAAAAPAPVDRDECIESREADAAEYEPGGEPDRTRFFLKIQDGCTNNCSYCVIPQVRGKPRSIPAEELMETAARMVAAGYPEIVVSGINAGIWHDEGMDLAGLMERLAGIGGLKRLRLSSIEVNGVTPELLEVMRRHPMIGHHLHIPLQSGDDRVLSAMGRRYHAASFTEVIKRAREALPDINLTTDVMVGFPGEDERAAERTLWMVEDLGFSKIHVFMYSPRPGTAAAALGDPVPVSVKKRRSRFLRFLSDRQLKARRQRKVGISSEILLESSFAPGIHAGYSADYTRFIVEGGRPGELVNVTGESVDDEGVVARVVEP